ncbi:MAG: glycosyltransferase family 25 protein [Hyphomicrobiales bacterium]|nr:glycosyltransferase family 25 protein [Hyphomicrobiales bacterium]
MKVYVLNLDRQPERLAHMHAQLCEAPFERIAAIEGAEKAPSKKGLTRFELACLASHRGGWRLFLDGPDTHACFLEDDLHVWPGFKELIAAEDWIPSDAHSVKLDTYLQKVRLGEAWPAPDGRQIARLFTRHESSAAYLLTRAGARQYLELTADLSLPADYALFPKHPLRLGLRIYQLTPAVAIQDHLLAREKGGQRLATAMADHEEPRQRPRSLVSTLRREVARLIVQGADVVEAVYLTASQRPRTTVVSVG